MKDAAVAYGSSPSNYTLSRSYRAGLTLLTHRPNSGATTASTTLGATTYHGLTTSGARFRDQRFEARLREGR